MEDNKPIRHLTPELLDGYVNGSLSPEMLIKVEQFLDENPFEAEAIEGYKQFSEDPAAEIAAVGHQLNDRLRPTKTRGFSYYWPLAAAIALLAVSGVIFFLLPDKTEPNAIVINQEPKTAVDYQAPESINDDSEDESRKIELKEESREQSDQLTLEKNETPGEGHVTTKASKASAPVQEFDQKEPYDTGNDALPQPLSEEATYPAVGQKVVVGKVRNQDQQPLAGALVAVKEKESTTLTDSNGFYQLQLPEESIALVSSYQGYDRQEVPITESAQIDIVLQEENSDEPVPTIANNRDQRSKKSARPQASRSSREITDLFPQASVPPGMTDYFFEHIEIPHEARQLGVQGLVRVSFTVNPNGSLTDFNVLEKLGYGCDEAAVAAIQSGPSWKPVKINGSPVASRAIIDVPFIITK